MPHPNSSPQILAIGPFPPTVTGAAKNTAIICDALEARGAVVFRIPTNKTRARTEHVRSAATYAERIKGFAANLTKLGVQRKVDPSATSIYLVADGGNGVALTAAYARAAVTRYRQLVVHHRSYNHIRNYSPMMSHLLKTAPEKTLHVFLDPVMESGYKEAYGIDFRSTYVPNAATCDVQPSAHPYARDRPAPITIGFLSNLVEDKGFDVVADAFAALGQRHGNNLRFLVAGRPVGNANEARLRVLQTALGGRLDYRGEIFGENKSDFFRECDIFVFPTRHTQEAQPNVLYEAMASGCAIISTRWAGIPWMLEGTTSSLIEPTAGQASQIANAVEGFFQPDGFNSARRHQVEAFSQRKNDAERRYTLLLRYLLNDLSEI